ncbi:sigma-70 family RNA polymerase sigma factor [Fulvivirgaceae bacterium BMA10]|uniref:Sigma-70 family RNA polymerase sigma factor n=1 Tax=Splendidivirga corallicola TaxID=3051826 RepID=A0ABT8KY16_9BACT|nr:sigma-70 family RNA polymerase sigma factor [Fulvivirgaceae bacterium BMA10]
MKNQAEDKLRKDAHLFLSYKSSDFDSHSDEEIWQALLKGSSIAFKYIYNKYADLLYDYGKKITKDNQLIEDCLHDLFIELWSRKASSANIRNLKAYLIISFRRKIISAEKKLSKYEKIASHQKFEMDLTDNLSELMEKEDNNLSALKDALNELPQRQKEALYLRFYNHLSCQDIAEIMAINPQSVYNLLHKALLMLKNKFTTFSILLGAMTLF